LLAAVHDRHGLDPSSRQPGVAMRIVRVCITLLLVPFAIALGVSSAAAQADSTATKVEMGGGGFTHLAGGYLIGSFPMGDWGEIAGFGLALDGADVLKPSGKPFGVRSNMGLLYNFSRTVGVPAGNIGAGDKLDIETKNWSLFFGLGPEFSVPNKDVSPFIFGTIGFDTYWTKSELSGTANGAAYSAKHGDNRIAFAWSGGVGLRKRTGTAYGVELSAEYRSGIRHDFLLPSDVHVSGAGVTASRESHSSDQILVRIGSVFGSKVY
jgi:hypothetical protein